MRLKRLELSGFKSFADKTEFLFDAPVAAIVGPNGSGKSNCAEAFRWVLGERSMKSLRGTRGEDLIFNGPTMPGGSRRTNRAAVTLVFDNRDRKFNIDFDEVSISREVYRDGASAYLINGSAVRYRDIVELLTGVGLGSSDHFIVNQGDADRILNAGERERRGLIEDALGLHIYQWKIEESEKKLERTEENIKRVESLRREIAPHLRFLKKQIERVEQADRLRAELKQRYFEYLTREEDYLQTEKRDLEREEAGPRAELGELERKLAGWQGGSSEHESREQGEKLVVLERDLRAVAGRKDELSRVLGRLEGRLEIKEASFREVTEARERDFSYQEVKTLTDAIGGQLAEADKMFDLNSVRSFLGKIRGLIAGFYEGVRGTAQSASQAKAEEELEQIKSERTAVDHELSELNWRESELLHAREELNREVATILLSAREAEREVYEWRARKSELSAILNVLTARREKWLVEEGNFRRELDEAVVLVDREILRYRELYPASGALEVEARDRQEERRRQLERIKIKLEDLGVDSGDTVKEYKEATERDEYLAKEITDLAESATSLQKIIAELREKIEVEFKAGLNKINARFQEFFALMFGGGSASLHLIKVKTRAPVLAEDGGDGVLGGLPSEAFSEPEEEEKAKEGIEVKVSLPRKKIRGLEMLSGGERALTSIALIFAMSQVNPPPFLILDETDAALDEANARKYGEMVENLAKHSQLILITHNRETMSRTDVIYGVTMGADGVSRLLSIKFDEAVGYAK